MADYQGSVGPAAAAGADSGRPAGIALIGMSGAGKSHLTRALSARGFPHVSVDQVIADQLNAQDGLDLGSLQAVAEWMGFPDSPTYLERSLRYRHFETAAIRDVAHRLESATTAGTTLIIDTTGSVVYLENGLLERLGRVAAMLHLATPAGVREQMLSRFRAEPTPLIWGECFHHRPGEPALDAVVRSYGPLMEHRESEYARWAHLTLGFEERHRAGFDIAAFLLAHGLTG